MRITRLRYALKSRSTPVTRYSWRSVGVGPLETFRTLEPSLYDTFSASRRRKLARDTSCLLRHCDQHGEQVHDGDGLQGSIWWSPKVQDNYLPLEKEWISLHIRRCLVQTSEVHYLTKAPISIHYMPLVPLSSMWASWLLAFEAVRKRD